MPDIKIMGAEIQDGTLWYAYQLIQRYYEEYYHTRKNGIYYGVGWSRIIPKKYILRGYVYRTKTQIVVRMSREDGNLV